MEVTTPKRLHRHTLPVLVLSLGLFVAGLVSFQTYADPGHRVGLLSTFLTGKVLTVDKQTDGLSHISLSPALASADTGDTDVAPPASTGLGVVSGVGESPKWQIGVGFMAQQVGNGAGGESRTPVFSLEN